MEADSIDVGFLRRLSVAIINQAFRDLQFPCAKIRADAAQYFEDPSPWAEMVNLHPDFIRKRVGPLLVNARSSLACRSGIANRQGEKRCPECKQVVIKQ